MTRVLDLYAGSGALGIEALSRGAAWCDFIERDPKACESIRENLRLTGFDDQARIYRLRVERALSELVGTYTLILADPPYDDRAAPGVLAELGNSSLIEKGRTILVMEHGARAEPPPAVGVLSLVNTRRHGDSAVSIYR